MKHYVVMAQLPDGSDYPVAVTTNPDEVNAVRAKFGMFNTWIVDNVRGAADILKPMYFVHFSRGGTAEKCINESNVLCRYGMLGRKSYNSDGTVDIWVQAQDEDEARRIAFKIRRDFLAKISAAMEAT